MKKKLLLFLAVTILCSNELFSQMAATTLKEKYIEIPGMVTLHYAEQGDANGTPVILLHGLTDSWHSYDLILPHMPESVHLYAISQRGHGGSGRPQHGYQPERFAKDIALFMKNLHIKQAVIVGHSMGAVVAQCFAVQYPELTKAVVLTGSLANCQVNPGLAELNRAVNRLENPIDRNFAKEFQQSTIMRAVPASFFEMVVDESMKVPVRIWKSVLKELMRADYTQQLETIAVPVLVIWGDKDAVTSKADQERLIASLVDAKLLVYKGTGHAAHWEEPERFTRDLLSFITYLK